MDFLRKNGQELGIQKEPVLFGAILEALRDLKEGTERLNLRLSELERKFEERIPEKALCESAFRQEVVDTEEVVKKIVSEVRSVARPIIASKEDLSIVESRRIQMIVSILQDRGRLNSSQLAEILNLSRTRANEYLKKMEGVGIAESTTIGKEKYYRLKD